MTSSLPSDVLRLKMNGRATDSQFAQNPLPLLTAMGYGLAAHHGKSLDGLRPCASDEAAAAVAHISSGGELPAPYDRSTPNTLVAYLENPPAFGPTVRCHGAPVVGCVVLTESVATYEGEEAWGADPAERDLAIVLRSVAERFSSEATRTFIDAYEAAGGALPNTLALDWFAMLAAFR